MKEIEPEIGCDVYGMPAFVTLTVADLDRTAEWYVNALGFVVLAPSPGPTDVRFWCIHVAGGIKTSWCGRGERLEISLTATSTSQVRRPQCQG